jgi:hypothetical protein
VGCVLDGGVRQDLYTPQRKKHRRKCPFGTRGTGRYRVRKLKTLNRYLKLIDKINHALERIKDETYGYFEETGEEISI